MNFVEQLKKLSNYSLIELYKNFVLLNLFDSAELVQEEIYCRMEDITCQQPLSH